MKIRTQAYLSAFISLAIIAVVALTLFVFEKRTRDAIARNQFAQSIIAEGISGLRVVTMEYVLHRQPRARDQWLLRHRTLTELIANDVLKATADEAILDDIRARNAYVGDVFAKLESVAGQSSPQGEPSEARKSHEDRLVTQIMLATQDMVVGADHLTRSSHQQLMEARDTAGALVLALVALIALIMLVNVAMVLRYVVRPLRRLTEGAQAIGAGNLGHRIRTRRTDEMGSLAHAFNGMAGSLAAVQEDVESKKALLEQANKDLESFAYSVSHDLRAPLRGIDGWSAALVEDFGKELDPKAQEYLALVRSETEHMAQLIDDLLKLSRVGRAEMRFEPVDLSALAQSTAASLAQSLPDRSIEFDIQEGLSAKGDAHLLQILLTNLLDNACKFTAPRPVARISVGESGEANPDPGRRPRMFFVSDNGVGFDLEHAKNLFGAFQRLHRQSDFPGTGIGLATVKRIVTRHGGQIRAEARVNEGATFHFSLGDAA